LGLITKQVEVTLSGSNIKHFEDLGYEIPRKIDKRHKNKLVVPKGIKIFVKVEDLLLKSHANVNIKCDGCGKELKNILWVDYLKCVKEDGKYYCVKCANAGFKKWISFEQWCIDNNYQDVLNRWDYELNDCKPKEISFGTNKKYYFKCPKGLHKSELKNIHSFTINNQKGSIMCNKCKTIHLTHPQLINYFVDSHDTKIYTSFSIKITLMRCPNCKTIREYPIYRLATQGFSCLNCSDGISYPEKFLFSILNQLNLKFITQLSKKDFKWCDNYRYDFYIDKINCIIETHGLQHYENIDNNWGSFEKIKLNDKNKEKLAKENDIKNYIVLDCRESNLEWIKNSIMNSELPMLLNFKEEDIDWLKCHEYACNSLVKIVCDLWNSGINNLVEINNKLKISKITTRRYLKQGSILGWCNYDPKKELLINKNNFKNKLSKKIVCITTNEIFNSQIKGANKYNINSMGISYCCNGKQKSAGKHPETGEKLRWMFYEDYIEQQDKCV